MSHFAELAKKHESHFQSELIRMAKNDLSNFVFLQHRNPAEAGTPDVSATGLGVTGWYELKVSRRPPAIRSRGVQDITLARLAERGLARYIILTASGLYLDTVDAIQHDTWHMPGKLMLTYTDLFHQIRSLHT